MDKYIFMGNIGNDAETKTMPDGKTMVTFSVAIDKSYKDKTGTKVAKTKWVSCIRFVDPARPWGLLPYLKKGTKVLVEGEPEVRAWLNPAGEAQCAQNVQVREITLAGSAPQAGSTQAAPQAQPAAQNQSRGFHQPRPAFTPPTHADVEAAGDDLPF